MTQIILPKYRRLSTDKIIKGTAKIKHTSTETNKSENQFDKLKFFEYKEKINLIHAPMFLISKVKKYQPSLEAKVSKNSKWMIGFMMVSLAVAVSVIPLFA